jgi:hypothetical protein
MLVESEARFYIMDSSEVRCPVVSGMNLLFPQGAISQLLYPRF